MTTIEIFIKVQWNVWGSNSSIGHKYQNESFQIFGILNLFFKNRFILDKIIQEQSIKCVCVCHLFFADFGHKDDKNIEKFFIIIWPKMWLPQTNF